MDNILQMRGISKSFFGVKALNNVKLDVKKGEVHALMGENGAGKSTLMKILNGMCLPDEGEIVFNGETIKISSPYVALQYGISMIYQELNPILDMTIAENIFIGREPMQKNRILTNNKQLYKEAEALLDQFKLHLKAKTKMHQLSTAQMQMIEMIKAVSLNAKLIVMDEPTSSLTEQEVKTLFNTIKELKSKQVTIIYITHRMEEIFQICDTVTVLRDGNYIDTKPISEITSDFLISMMVGCRLTEVFPKNNNNVGEPVLEVHDLCRKNVFSHISFNLKSGEILGFYGLVGAGRSEVMKAIFGLDPYDSGEIFLNRKKLDTGSVKSVMNQGVAMVTEDRKKYGLVSCRSLRENISLPNLDRFSIGPFINKKLETNQCIDIKSKLSIKMKNLDQEVSGLSGGNQQKIVLSKWLIQNPKVFIMDESTRGIDVGAKAEIYQLMAELTSNGVSIIMVSSELPEIIGMSDRVVVMGDGKIKSEFIRGNFTQDDLLSCAIGEEIK